MFDTLTETKEEISTEAASTPASMAEAAPTEAPAADAPIALVVEHAALQKALGHVQSVVERRNTVAILSNVLLRAKGETLSLTATDMDVSITEHIAATIEQEGITTIPAHTLYEIVRKLPDGSQITLKHDDAGNNILLEAGSSNFSLPCLPSAEFPFLDEGELPCSFSLPTAEAISLLEKARFAMSTEETRYYLNGIYFHAIKGENEQLLRSVATDGHRLARIETAIPQGAENMPGVIIPRKTVTELRKLLEDDTETLHISLSATKIRFVYGSITFLSKLIDGTFPDYSRVIPTENDKIMEVNCKALIKAVDRVSTITSEKARSIKLVVSSGKIELSATNDESNGSAREELEANYAATPINTGFNSRYLMEMLSECEGETVQFLFSDDGAPAIVRDTGSPGSLYVIMPMRI